MKSPMKACHPCSSKRYWRHGKWPCCSCESQTVGTIEAGPDRETALLWQEYQSLAIGPYAPRAPWMLNVNSPAML